jgi:hypothetical protein
MKLRPPYGQWLLLVVLAVMGWGGGGCKTSEADNDDAKPWATPKSWETGMPGGMLDQQRK